MTEHEPQGARADSPAPRPPSRWSRLPDPIRPEDMITSSEASPHPPEKDDYWREVEWMLRVSGAG
jgi:hypothetical protein